MKKIILVLFFLFIITQAFALNSNCQNKQYDVQTIQTIEKKCSTPILIYNLDSGINQPLVFINPCNYLQHIKFTITVYAQNEQTRSIDGAIKICTGNKKIEYDINIPPKGDYNIIPPIIGCEASAFDKSTFTLLPGSGTTAFAELDPYVCVTNTPNNHINNQIIINNDINKQETKKNINPTGLNKHILGYSILISTFILILLSSIKYFKK